MDQVLAFNFIEGGLLSCQIKASILRRQYYSQTTKFQGKIEKWMDFLVFFFIRLIGFNSKLAISCSILKCESRCSNRLKSANYL